MFDVAPLCQGLVGEDSFYALLAEHGDRNRGGRQFCRVLLTGHRPALDPPPSLLAKVLLLQYREGLSDERAMEAMRLHLGWNVPWGWQSTTAAFTRPPWSSSAPACSCTARSAWHWSARWRWQQSWG